MLFFNKEKISKGLDLIFLEALEREIFPGAVVGISLWNGKNYCNNIYHYGISQKIPVTKKLDKDTFFDLASLTKPLAIVPALLSLMEDNKIFWDMSLDQIFKKKFVKNKGNIQIKQLMSHCSGLPAHKNYFVDLLKLKEKDRKENLFKWIIGEDLVYIPGSNCIYSDIGYMLLGFIIEKITGKDLDEYIKEKIFKPLSLHNKLFFPEKEKRQDVIYAATEKCPWAGQMLSGKVHDDNCRALGGVAGHAGLFGNMDGVLSLCEGLLSQIKGRGVHPFYSNEQLRRAVKKENISTWAYGFDTPSVNGSSSGQYFSKNSFGHLGFTGTSFWIDLQKEIIVVLLTNRVHPNRQNELIRKFRPLFHDTVLCCLD